MSTASYGNPTEIRPNFGAALIPQTVTKNMGDRIVSAEKLLATRARAPMCV